MSENPIGYQLKIHEKLATQEQIGRFNRKTNINRMVSSGGQRKMAE